MVRFRGFIRVKSWKTLTTTMIPRRRTKDEVQIIETNFGRFIHYTFDQYIKNVFSVISPDTGS